MPKKTEYINQLKHFLGLQLPSNLKNNGEDRNPKSHTILKTLPKESITLTGKVLEFLVNPMEDIDKILLSTEEKNVAVHFPPHKAQAILEKIQIGQFVNLSVCKSKKMIFKSFPLYDLIHLQEPFLNLDTLKPQKSKGAAISVQGFISNFRYNDRNFVSAFFLENYLVDIPPHFGEIITPVLSVDKEVSIQGHLRQNNMGFINKSGLEIIRPYALNVDGTNYLL